MSIRNTLKIGDIPLPLEIGRGLYYYTSESLAKAKAEKLKTVSDMVRWRVEPKDLQRDNAGLGKAKSKVLFDWLRALDAYPYRGEITEEDVFRLLEGKIATAHKVVELARDDGLDPVSVAHVEKLFERLLESGRMASFAAPFGVDLANIYVDFIG